MAYYIVGAWPRRSLVCAFENIIVWEVIFPVYLFDTWLKNWPFLFICLFVCLKTKKANNIETVITVSSIGTFPCWFGFLIFFFLFCLILIWCLMTYLSLSSLSLSLQGLGVWSLDHIPRGTRFGPLVGEVFSREPYSRKETDRISLWKVKIFFY